MKKVLIAADEVDKWSRLCEGLQNEWECTTVNLDAFEKFHTIAVYDAVLMLVRNDTKTSNTPKTGDTANAVLWIAILALSAAGITGVRIWNKKKQVKRLGIEEKKEEEE